MVGLCGQISGCVKPSVKRFFFGVLFIHHCKTFIKADQTSSFYPSMNDILYQKYLKKTKCHCDNVFLSEATKTSKQKARISHFRSTSGQQFCSRISCLHTFGRPKTTSCSLLSHAPQNVLLDLARLNSESSKTCLCLAVILMHLFKFRDGLYWWIISILDTRLCFTCSTVLQSG